MERDPLSVKTDLATRRAIALSTERKNILILFNNYKASIENLNWKVSKQYVIVQEITASVKQLEKRTSSLLDSSKLLTEADENFMRNSGEKNCGGNDSR